MQEQILELLQKEQELFAQVIEYGHRMKELSPRADYEAYQELSIIRDEYLEKLKKNEIILQRNYQKLKNQPEFESIRANVQALRADSLELARELLELDILLKKRLLEEKEQIVQELQNLHKGHQGMKHYQQKEQPRVNGAYTDSRR